MTKKDNEHTLSEKEETDYITKVVSSFEVFKKDAKKEAKKRARDVLPQLKLFDKYPSGIHETYDLARQEIRASLNRYVIGYYGESIYHSTLAVETALLLKLDELLSDAEKNEIHNSINSKDNRPLSFTFGAILDESKRKNRKIINNTEFEQKIKFLIEVRNRYIHANNLNVSFIKSYKEKLLTQIEFGLKNIDTLDEIRLLKLIPSTRKSLQEAKEKLLETKRMIQNLPNLEWCTKENNRLSTQLEVDGFIDDLFTRVDEKISSLNTTQAKVALLSTSKDWIRQLSEDKYSRDNSLKCIQVSCEVLEEFGLFARAKKKNPLHVINPKN